MLVAMLVSSAVNIPTASNLFAGEDNALAGEFGTNLDHFLKVIGLNHGISTSSEGFSLLLFVEFQHTFQVNIPHER